MKINFESRATDWGEKVEQDSSLEIPSERKRAMDAICGQQNSNWTLGEKFTLGMVRHLGQEPRKVLSLSP